MEKLQEIELFIKDESKDGTFAIALVESPANQDNFVALSEGEICLKVIDEEKRIVLGAVLIPEQRIYRKMKPKGHDKEVEFNIFFTAETIEKSEELYMKNLYLNNSTSEHIKPIQGVSTIESWIVEDEKQDKSNLYNLKAVKGTWVIKQKIYNDEEWQKVKNGEYKGFSIEGVYEGFENLKLNKEMDIIEQLREVLNANTNLSSDKVELNSLGDFDKAVDAVIDAYGMGINRKNGAKEPIKSAIDQLENALKAKDRAVALGMQLEKQIKDLGLSLPSNYESIKSRLFDEEKRIIEAIKKLKDINLNF